MKKQHGYAIWELLGLLLILAAVGGWIANLVKFIGMLDGGVSAMFIARIVGVFAVPLGAVLGFF